MKRLFILPILLFFLAPCYGVPHDGLYLLVCFKEVNSIDNDHCVTLEGSQKAGFLHGLVEGISIAGDGRFFRLPAEWTQGESEAILRSYLNDHPDQLTEEGSVLVLESLKSAYPLKKTP